MDEPIFYYVRDSASRAAHHWDYEQDRSGVALCGHEYEGEIRLETTERPRAVCRTCQQLTGPREARWWRDRARDIQAELDELTVEVQALRTQQAATTRLESEIERLRTRVENQREQLSRLQQQSAGRRSPRRQTARQASSNQSAGAASRGSTRANSSTARRSPRIQIVSGGAPGLGKRR